MKLAIFVDVGSGWSLSQLYKEVAPRLGAELFDWQVDHPLDIFESFDRVLTLPHAGSEVLTRRYRYPREQVLLVAHAECDVQKLLRREPGHTWERYAGYAVVSDTLACSSLALGVTRVPTVLRQGINGAQYDLPVPNELRSVGYAALVSRKNEWGVEIKRGELVRRAVERAGLELKVAQDLTRSQMVDFYKGVDALVMSSLQEGGAMPPYEAAAAGRLVIGTPVGDFPRLAHEGMGLLAPLNDEAFVDKVSELLTYYQSNPLVFQHKCENIKTASHGRHWDRVISDWQDFVSY